MEEVKDTVKSNGRTARKKETGRHYMDSNQFSWTSLANVVWVEQPVGVSDLLQVTLEAITHLYFYRPASLKGYLI